MPKRKRQVVYETAKLSRFMRSILGPDAVEELVKQAHRDAKAELRERLGCQRAKVAKRLKTKTKNV